MPPPPIPIAAEPALAARDLAVGPPGAHAEGVAGPDGISLEVRPGEWLAVTGPNGGGKSSLLLTLAGLWSARRGRVTLSGRDFGPGAPPELRRTVAVVLQDPSVQLLQPTLGEELTFAARNLGHRAEAAEASARAWARRLGLDADPGLDPRTLSAGGQQLAILAGALAAAPDLLIADEAAAHLDRVRRGRVLAALGEARDRGLALIWATQEQQELAAADRVLTIGSVGPAPAPTPAPPEGPTLLVLEVEPAIAPAAGPRIEISVPLRIEITRRGVAALVGRNGTGKTVLLEVGAGALDLGQVTRTVHDQRRPPLLVGQYPERLFFADTVADEVAYAAVKRGIARSSALDEATRCFAALNIGCEPFLRRRLWELSGGERRMVELVAALIAPADLLLLDEPTAGLDPFRRAALAGLVADRARVGAVLVATQDRPWASSLGARQWTLGEEPGEAASASKKTD